MERLAALVTEPQTSKHLEWSALRRALGDLQALRAPVVTAAVVIRSAAPTPRDRPPAARACSRRASS
jgi:hypothetical protein